MNSPLPAPPEAELPEVEESETRPTTRKAQEERLERLAQRRVDEASMRQELRVLSEAINGNRPPANGSEVELTARHKEPPFDPGVRRDLRQQPREARGRVARRDSVLFDQVGARTRQERSAERADAVETRQLERGRRAFEIRQRQTSKAASITEARAEARRLEEHQRLEASDLRETIARSEARRRAIERNLADNDGIRDSVNASIATSVQDRRTRAEELRETARRQQTEIVNTRANARSTAVTARQRDVFQLQLAVANTRRVARENPAQVVGDEAQQTAEKVRSERDLIEQLRADAREKVELQDLRRSDDNRGVDRSQNIRRRLANSYGQRRSGGGQGIARA